MYFFIIFVIYVMFILIPIYPQGQVDDQIKDQVDENSSDEKETDLLFFETVDSIRKSKNNYLPNTERNRTLKDSLAMVITDYNISSVNHRRNTFDWQYTSGIIIFWMVILIVLSGLVFSGLQFYISFKSSLTNASAKDKVDSQEDKQPDVTEFEASLSGVKVKSSVIGIIILAVSLAFFYLYLVHVYPITEISNLPRQEVSTDQ